HSTTRDTVMHHLHSSSVVHFACHGTQDLENPINSGLILSDGCLDMSRIMHTPCTNCPTLHNCMKFTATAVKDLEEESVDLAAGMLTAGYRNVIATMWSIGVDDAPKVARDVYEHLFKISLPDPAQAAEALHLAVWKLKNGAGRRKSFFHWVPLIHIGV
ncbi:CHAT domain-containing protein, partial [Mycena leptocephala]